MDHSFTNLEKWTLLMNNFFYFSTSHFHILAHKWPTTRTYWIMNRILAFLVQTHRKWYSKLSIKFNNISYQYEINFASKSNNLYDTVPRETLLHRTWQKLISCEIRIQRDDSRADQIEWVENVKSCKGSSKLITAFVTGNYPYIL